ncbi:macrophage colony-stimulating factor 1 receptor-like [Ptychodera flava]|uniref:macrophage colony-stimulating factor 1 receptor-like n=1 Tax=Ptychodera flava TaxID=63121 RepID=UPI00396AA26C
MSNEFYNGKIGNGTEVVYLDVQYSPRIASIGEIFEAEIGDVIIISCKANGFPSPKVLWYDVANDIILGNEQNRVIMIERESEQQLTTTLIITVADETYYGTYTCEASNTVQSGVLVTMKIVTPECTSFEISDESSQRSQGDTKSDEVGHFTARDHGRGKDENKFKADDQGKYYEVPVNKKRKDDDQHYTSLSPQKKDERIYQHLWKTEHLEVSREFLSIRDELHEGAFCRVVKAEAWNIAGKDGTTIVAIKTPKASADPAIRKMFLKELDLLKSIGSHQHVITLLVVVVESEPHYIILEYMGLGNLQNYLRESRSVKDDTLKVDGKRAQKGSDLMLHLRELSVE